jgi:GSH-dependent disulfide-bond oxidoreductase
LIELYYWPTPNGHKIAIFLEEAGLPYEIRPVNIGAGQQFSPDFLRIAPNNRIPAILDRAPADGDEPVAVFESGAILIYLAEKIGRYLPGSGRARKTALEWLIWQVAGLGPMAGQNNHFARYAAEKLPYAIERYVNETNRLFGVLDRQLVGRAYIAGDYSIADMACYPWIVPHERLSQRIADFPALSAWFRRMAARPAVVRAYERGAPWTSTAPLSDEARKILFGQTAASTRR